tara:strand:+ start:2068 stop:3345 length:1278 start_codon:yes stop_codon:yes gene_type:complete
MSSNSKNIAELLNTETTIATADIADGAISNAKVAANAGIVTTKISGLDAQIDNGLGSLENEIGLLNVNRLIDNGAALDDFVKGFSDAFTDETGVNTGANSNATYSATNDTYEAAENTTFAWTTITDSADASTWAGDTSRWTFNTTVDSGGNYGGNVRTGVYYNSDQTSDGDIIRIQMADTSNAGCVVWYASNKQNHIGTTGNRYWLGIGSSNSSHWADGNPSAIEAGGLAFKNGTVNYFNPAQDEINPSVSYNTSDLFVVNRHASTGAITIKKNGSTIGSITHSKALTSSWRVALGHPAEGAGVNFTKIDVGGTSNSGTWPVSTFQTNAQTATSQPSTIRLVLIGKENQSQTINTDTVWSISRDGGTTFSSITMTQSGNYNSSGVKIYTGTVDVSGQPSGTSVVLKQTTVANKSFAIHGYSLIYK